MANKLLLDLSGGMNAQAAPLVIQDDECEIAINYILDEAGRLKKRKGYSQYANQPQANMSVLGLFELRRSSTWESLGLRRTAMAIKDTTDTNYKIYISNSGANFTEEFTVAKAFWGGRTRWAAFVSNALHITSGTATSLASADDGGSWTSAVPAPINGSDQASSSADIVVFQDRLYAIGGKSLLGGTDPNYNRVYFSSLPSGAPLNVTWTDSDHFDVNPDDNDALMGGHNNGNRLLLFKREALYRWTFGQLEPDRLIGVGTHSIESVRTNFDRGITFFAHPTGIYAYTGERPQLISRKIQPYIDAVSDWSTVCAEVDGDHYFLSVGNLTVNSKTITNAVLVYHISLDAWTIFALAHKPVVFARMYGSTTTTVQSVFFGDSTGKVFKLFDGTDDAGSAIATEFRSKEYLLSYPNRTTIKNIDVFSSNNNQAGVFLEVDRKIETYEPIGALTDRITTLTPRKFRECNTVRISIGTSGSADATIDGFNIEHEPAEKRSENVKIRRGLTQARE